jgi:hypothetical protein
MDITRTRKTKIVTDNDGNYAINSGDLIDTDEGDILAYHCNICVELFDDDEIEKHIREVHLNII